MARRKIVAGNWKMNKTPSEAKALVELLAPLVQNDDVDVVYCVPAVDITTVVEAVRMDVLERICKALGVDFGDVCSFKG